VGELRDEDRVLVRWLSRHVPTQAADPADETLEGDDWSGVAGALYNPHTHGPNPLDRALETTAILCIYGIAPRSLVEAMQRVAKRVAEAGKVVPWKEIVYVTPTTEIVLANRGNARLGLVVQKWQSALNGIRNCVWQVMADAETATGNAHSVELTVLGADELFLEVAIVTNESARLDGASRLWVSFGPNLARDEGPYLVLSRGTPLFDRLSLSVEQLRTNSTPIVTRQLDMSPAGLEQVNRETAPGRLPHLQVRSLQLVGTKCSPPACLPVAVAVLRSAAVGKPIVLLKLRTRFNDTDDFGRLSLLSARLREEDLAAALGVPLFSNRSAEAALDAMWKAHGRPEPLPVSLQTFVRAAQRDVFVTCGLDIATDRFVHRGCQVIEREDRGCFLFFCVFEVVLRRHQVESEDELLLAEAWNSEQLVRVNESELYTAAYVRRYNRLLVRRQEWLQENVFNMPAQNIKDG
jgi:hypothetical protein